MHIPHMLFNRHQVRLTSVVLVLLIAGPTTDIAPAQEPQPPPLTISILPSRTEAGQAYINHGGKFSVQITNNSKEPIKLWSQRCDLGHAALTFEATEEKGERMTMRPRKVDASAWEERPPRTLTILAGATHTRYEFMSSFHWGERTWQDVPEPNTGQPMTLKAVFEIKPNEATKAKGVWTGRITSEPVKVLIENERLKTPHDYLWDRCPKQALKMLQVDRTWIGKRGDHEQTVLHIASRFGPIEVVKWLLENGADPRKDLAYNNFSPLHIATDPAIIKLLIEHKAVFEPKNSSAQTPLQNAADHLSGFEHVPNNPYKTVVRMLLEGGAVYDVKSAIYLNDLARVAELLKKDPKEAEAKKDELLHLAAKEGRASIVKLLLTEHKADPNAIGNFGMVPLYIGAAHPDVVKTLLDGGADPNPRQEFTGFGRLPPQGETVLHAAGHPRTAELLLARGVPVDPRTEDGMTPLHYAASSGDAETVVVLLKHKADPRAVGGRGITPLAAAARGIWAANSKRDREEYDQRRRVIEVLHKHGVPLDIDAAVSLGNVDHVKSVLRRDPAAANSKDDEKEPILFRAVVLGNPEVVAALLAAGANVNATDEDGVTALHKAAWWERADIAKLLIAAGANVNAQDKSFETPLFVAENQARGDDSETVDLLKKHGAKR